MQQDPLEGEALLAEVVKPTPAEPVEASQPTPPTLVDEFYGHGGTYIVDPVTGTRERIAP
jgi:hypothetical protein